MSCFRTDINLSDSCLFPRHFEAKFAINLPETVFPGVKFEFVKLVLFAIPQCNVLVDHIVDDFELINKASHPRAVLELEECGASIVF